VSSTLTTSPRFSVIIPTHNRLKLLQQTIESVLDQDFPSDRYEIIVSSDGSTDGTREYLESLDSAINFRWSHIESSGASAARNRGAALARGEILAFIDDDCRAPHTWLSTFDRVFQEQRVDAVFGKAVNRIANHLLPIVYEEMNTFLHGRFNEGTDLPSFLTTNNLACSRTVLEAVGGFDERFLVGAEDRELGSRLLAAGKTLVFDPSITVDHYHAFSFHSFVSHHVSFGRGSYLFLNVVAPEKQLPPSHTSFSDVVKLLQFVGRGKALSRRLLGLSVVIVAQLSILAGYLSASIEGVTDLHEERRREETSAGHESQGTTIGLFSFLGGTVVSSSFGLLSFIILGNVLALPDFGVFMVAFSLEAIVSGLANLGLPTSIARFASELSKKGDATGVAATLRKGLLVQSSLVAIVLVGLWLTSDLLVNDLFVIDLPPPLFFAVMAGVCSSAFFQYFSSVYSIFLRFNNLVLLRTAVSVVRLAAIGAVVVLGFASPISLYLAFTLPNGLGALMAYLEYRKHMRETPSPTATNLRTILSFGGWHTVSQLSRLLITHIGLLILAMFSTQEEAGTFGLGLTLSFLYGVIASAMSSYFLPLAARIRSENEIPPFLLRSFRLGFPLAILCFATLLVSFPLVRLLFGEAKTAAVPVFILLALPLIGQMMFTGISAFFHYLFRPEYGAYEMLLRLTVFAAGSFALAGYGALGIALAFLCAGVIGIAFSVFLAQRELRKLGLRFTN
jgi:O-antigen/teichoic acid export membrane protein/glycosyltransferase involved in cell wall biosynthesis